jgi:DNA polymerase-3 subunit beta
MKFICEQEDLLKSINTAIKAVTSRSTLPILKGFLLKSDREEGTVSLSSSDLELSIETKIKGIVEESGECVISAKIFSDIVRKIAPGSVIVTLGENDYVDIKSGNYETHIQGVSSEEFPKIENMEEGEELEIEKDLLAEIIKRTSFAASLEEARGIITGVLTELEKGKITMVALDGYRMAIRRAETKNETEKKFIISGRIINEIGKILSEQTDDDETVKIKVGEKRAVFRTKDTKVITRLLEGEFIKYKDIIPQDNKVKVNIKRKDLLDSIERASIIAREGKNSFIRMSMGDGFMTISSRAEEGDTKETVEYSIEGEGIEIGFNARYAADTLKAIQDEEILMEFNTGLSPCLVKPVEGESYEYLILPVRLSSVNI